MWLGNFLLLGHIGSWVYINPETSGESLVLIETFPAEVTENPAQVKVLIGDTVQHLLCQALCKFYTFTAYSSHRILEEGIIIIVPVLHVKSPSSCPRSHNLVSQD